MEVVVERADGEKCNRCYSYDITVGELPINDVCERCLKVLLDMEDYSHFRDEYNHYKRVEESKGKICRHCHDRNKTVSVHKPFSKVVCLSCFEKLAQLHIQQYDEMCKQGYREGIVTDVAREWIMSGYPKRADYSKVLNFCRDR